MQWASIFDFAKAKNGSKKGMGDNMKRKGMVGEQILNGSRTERDGPVKWNGNVNFLDMYSITF